jgi:hypothetical protein
VKKIADEHTMELCGIVNVRECYYQYEEDKWLYRNADETYTNKRNN